jgi:hypothetical protein
VIVEFTAELVHAVHVESLREFASIAGTEEVLKNLKIRKWGSITSFTVASTFSSRRSAI